MTAPAYEIRRDDSPTTARSFQGALAALLRLLRADLEAAQAAGQTSLAGELDRAIVSARLCWTTAPGPRPGHPYWLEVQGRLYLLAVVEP